MIRSCLLALVLLHASLVATDPTKAIREFSHQVFQTDDGLPQNTIYSILQTHDGFLWFGTQEGLARYDGVTFTVFSRATVPGFPHNTILHLYEAKDSTLWISTSGGAIAYRYGQFTFYTTRDSLPDPNVNAIAVDTNGVVWMGTNSGLVSMEKGQFRKFTRKDGLSNDYVKTVLVDRSGRLWVGTNGGGLNLLKDGKWKTYTTREGLSSNYVSSLYESRRNDLWIGTFGGGVTRLKDGQFSTILQGLSNPNVLSVTMDSSYAVWIATLDGIHRWYNGKFAKFSKADGLSKEIALSVYVDHEQSVWVGTYGGGVNRFKDRRFRVLASEQGLPNDFVRSVSESPKGGLWVGTDGGGISLLKEGKVTNYGFREGLNNLFVRAVLEDRTGRVWVGTNGGGVNVLEKKKFKILTTKEGLAFNDISCLYEDRAGGIWVGTNGGGLTFIFKDKFTNYSTKDGLAGDAVTCVLQDKKNRVWIGSSTGLTLFQDPKITKITAEDGLPGNDIYSLLEDSRGTIWVGTGGGLCRQKKDDWKVYTVQEGLPSNAVFGILEDHQGSLWLSSNRGIFEVSIDSLDALDEGRLASLTGRLYGKSDDMSSSECSGGSQPAVWRTARGVLSFATIKGVAEIDPKQLRHNRTPPPVTIHAAVIDGESSPLSASLTVPPGRDRYEFQYAGLSFFSPEKVQFRYRLHGFDDEWIDAQNRRVAYYTSLPPGKYRFEVTACNNDGVWQSEPASLAIVVQPHFYQTWWFYSLTAVVVVGFAFGLYRLRVQQLVARERKLQLLVDERTKELQTEKDKSEKLLLNILPEPIAEKLKAENGTIAESFAEATILFADIVDFTKLSARISPEELVEFLNHVFSAFDTLAETHGMEKIKTIGDAYMVVAGLPEPRADHAEVTAEMALAMQDELVRINTERKMNIKVRIGINTGPVVAGVIGKRKFIYDLWGDAVNTASRMESHGLAGCIQVTESTYEKLKKRYELDERGTVEVKGKGHMKTFLLQGRK